MAHAAKDVLHLKRFGMKSNPTVPGTRKFNGALALGGVDEFVMDEGFGIPLLNWA